MVADGPCRRCYLARQKYRIAVAPPCPLDVRFGSKADIEARPPDVRFTPKSGHSELGLFRCSNSRGFASYRPVVASGSGDRAALVEYRRLLTSSSHLSSPARPFAILNPRRAIRDLVPQTPSDGPARNPSSISRLCAAIISPSGGFDLLVPCSGATAAVWPA